ncbi:MAG: hypothetical protein ACKOA8_10105, partial [Deltaproteobacteria bacterium]
AQPIAPDERVNVIEAPVAVPNPKPGLEEETQTVEDPDKNTTEVNIPLKSDLESTETTLVVSHQAPANVCMPDASGFDRFLKKVKWKTFGGKKPCIWCWSDPPWAGSGEHSQLYSNMVESYVKITGYSSGNNCNTPNGEWPHNDSGAHALDFSGLPDGEYVVRIAVDGYTYRTNEFVSQSRGNSQPVYSLKLESKYGVKTVYDPPKMTEKDFDEKYFSWDGCVPFTVEKGKPTRIVSDVVISFSVPPGGVSDTRVFQSVKHKTYLMGILPKDEFRSPTSAPLASPFPD